MENQRVGTLRLSKESTEKFVRSYFYPTQEEIREMEASRARIREEMKITPQKRGFTVEIEDLDLDLPTMEHEDGEYTINVEDKITIKKNDEDIEEKRDDQGTGMTGQLIINEKVEFTSYKMNTSAEIAA